MTVKVKKRLNFKDVCALELEKIHWAKILCWAELIVVELEKQSSFMAFANMHKHGPVGSCWNAGKDY